MGLLVKSYESFDTINTLIDFSILNIKSSKGNTLVEIAPHIPLSLGRIDINYANTQDASFSATSLGTCSTGTIGNRFLTIDKDNSIESLSTTANPRKYHNHPVYAGSTYIGKFVMSTLHTDQDTIYLYLDTPLSITATGLTINVLGEITSESGVSVSFGETEKLTHELSLLNAGHLHAGKIICSLSPHIATDSINKTVPLNYRLYYGTMDEEHTSSEKFGSPYFRIINLEKGNYNRITQPITTDLEEVSLYYLEKLSKVPYYASAYKFNLGHEATNTHITGVGKTGNSTDNHSIIESRGNLPMYMVLDFLIQKYM